MGAVSVLIVCAAALWLNGFCLPINQNGGPKQWHNLKSENDPSLRRAIVFLQSMDSRLKQKVKEVQLETNEVEMINDVMQLV
ncbi:hypothetical protein AMECASPLE_032801 [Ameca splendens]|uniref:Uncharacterized protein n=1 Tax=Ameca splendens TaxID=208324 RepID=A0ABV0ZFH2_9TELE